MSLLTEQEIRSIANSVKEIGENSDRALILASQKAVIEKIKAQGQTGWIGRDLEDFSYKESAYFTIPLYRLPEGD